MRHPPNLSPDQLNPRKRREGHAVRGTVAGCLGEVPAVLPLQGSKQALKTSQGASTRLRAPKLRGNPPSNRLQLLSPVLGFAPARHGTAPPPPQAEQRAKPGCSTRGAFSSREPGSTSREQALATCRQTASDIAEVHPRRMQGQQLDAFQVLLRRNRSHIAKFPSIPDQVFEISVSLTSGRHRPQKNHPMPSLIAGT